MRTRTIFALVVAMGCMTLAGSALAQVATNPMPNPAAEAQWNRFLANHPGVEAGMINNPNYLSAHPGIATWLQQHPDVAAYARQQGQIGGWDRENRWHNREWWETHDPDWVRKHHPDWAQNNPHFGREGDYDENRQWHDRDWWVKNRSQWVKEHHPAWWAAHHGKGHHDHDND